MQEIKNKLFSFVKRLPSDPHPLTADEVNGPLLPTELGAVADEVSDLHLLREHVLAPQRGRAPRGQHVPRQHLQRRRLPRPVHAEVPAVVQAMPEPVGVTPARHRQQ